MSKPGPKPHYASSVIANRFVLTAKEKRDMVRRGLWRQIILITDTSAIRLILGISR